MHTMAQLFNWRRRTKLYFTDMTVLPLTLPLTALPEIVLVHGAILDSTFPGPNSYPFRNGFWVMNIMRGAGELDLLDKKESFTAGL